MRISFTAECNIIQPVYIQGVRAAAADVPTKKYAIGSSFFFAFFFSRTSIIICRWWDERHATDANTSYQWFFFFLFYFGSENWRWLYRVSLIAYCGLDWNPKLYGFNAIFGLVGNKEEYMGILFLWVIGVLRDFWRNYEKLYEIERIHFWN